MADVKQNTPCKYLDVESHCLVVLQLVDDYFYPTPEECSACRRCRPIGQEPSEHGGINDFTLLKAQEIGFALDTSRIGKGPGTLLKTTISWFVDQPPGCDCQLRSTIMDLWGYDKCREKESTIRSWLRESARINNIKVPDSVITTVINLVLSSMTENLNVLYNGYD